MRFGFYPTSEHNGPREGGRDGEREGGREGGPEGGRGAKETKILVLLFQMLLRNL